MEAQRRRSPYQSVQPGSVRGQASRAHPQQTGSLFACRTNEVGYGECDGWGGVDEQFSFGDSSIRDGAGERLQPCSGYASTLGKDFESSRRYQMPLILATQRRDVPLVRLLLARRADPKRNDSVAGMSAIDYAKKDLRAAAVLQLLQAKAPSTSGQSR